MTHALVTVVAPLDPARLAEAEARIDALGNPAAGALRDKLDRLDGEHGTHFCSLHAVRSFTEGKAYLALELSADGTPAEAIARLAAAAGPELATVFALATDWRAGDLAAYLGAHRVVSGNGLGGVPGLAFAGTPGMTVGRIRAERLLATQAADTLATLGGGLGALDRLRAVRTAVAAQPDLAPMLQPGLAAPPYEKPGIAGLVGGLVASFITTYLWPVVIALLLLAVVGGVRRAADVAGFWPSLGGFALGALQWLLVAGLVALILAVLKLVALYLALRRQEDRDPLERRTADPAVLAAMVARENHGLQNHMLSVTCRKPGPVRWFTARLVFWVIGELAARYYRPGYLSDIGTIHFARWVTVPGTRDLLFFSNFDHSWESYLEDFITKAHAGLTGVWSNSVGFPRTRNLFQQGATDGERFKRYARQSMIPTRFWYSAYPELTTTEIRVNALVRLGLSGALTEDEAARWLALFGSAARPPGKLASSEIQSIVFGGLGFMPHGTCLLAELPPTVADARAWLAAVLPHVAFNDGRRLRQDAVVTLALGAEGLRRLGLPEEGLGTFPPAFLAGLADGTRARILGDTGDNAATHWRWGTPAPHAALLLYGVSAEAVDALEARLAAHSHGTRIVHRVALKPITDDKREPFGFADGISQPLIRGTHKGLQAADPIHLVEPGEFILGYPDNRGNVPPGPVLPAMADPHNQLPLVDAADDFTRVLVNGPRDLGRDGSFLVIRELEQDVERFRAYCRAEAERLADRLPAPYQVTPEFIGAKLVGRWPDGSSLVRHPYAPRTRRGDKTPATERPATAPDAADANPVPRPAKQSHRQDNDFLFGTEDPEALRCPFGAHIRRANPRDSLAPGDQDGIDISNRHNILRVGRQYEPAPGGRPGLLFMCLNADIERQFEFVQQTWLANPAFHGLSAERDPLAGEDGRPTTGFTVPTRSGPVRLAPVPATVATRGGGYFFLPGRRLLAFLAAGGAAQ